MATSTKDIHVIHQDEKFIILNLTANRWCGFDEIKSEFWAEGGDKIKLPKGSKWVGLASEILDAPYSKELLKSIKMTADEWSLYFNTWNISKGSQIIYLGDIDEMESHIDNEENNFVREKQAVLIAKQIQKKLYQLHSMGYTMDSNFSGIHLFDNNIKPEDPTDVIDEQGGLDYSTQIIYTFNLGADKK